MLQFFRICGILMLISCSLAAMAQEKRIDEAQVSAAIKTYLQTTYMGAGKIKYYRETENDTTFTVAEFRQQDKEYALEFLPDGRLYEVEVEVEFEQLPAPVKARITNALNQQFSKYKIRECEIVNPGPAALYELNVKGHTANSRKFYEIYFDASGNFMRSSEVLIKPIHTLF